LLREIAKLCSRFYFDPVRFFRAALAPSLPSAVRVFFGKYATVLFRRAALAASLMFRFAATRCFLVVVSFGEQE
jgi:hypothetical protein